MNERLINLFSKDKLLKLESKNILLVGVGGVGSAIFEVLIRSGIKKITIIDYDVYELSNLNRQLHSNLNNLNNKKVIELRDFAKSIDPNIEVIIRDEFLTKDSEIDYLSYDYIIDACDSIDAKINLIKNALSNNIKIISSMGVGNRINPTDLLIEDINKTYNDPLAKKLRSELRKEMENFKFPVIFSKELPIKSQEISSYIVVSMTAGILVADYVLKDLMNE